MQVFWKFINFHNKKPKRMKTLNAIVFQKLFFKNRSPVHCHSHSKMLHIVSPAF